MKPIQISNIYKAITTSKNTYLPPFYVVVVVDIILFCKYYNFLKNKTKKLWCLFFRFIRK